MAEQTVFAAPGIATFWRYIESSLDRLVAVGGTMPSEGLAWTPPAPATNPVSVLVRHTMGNAEGNLLGVLCGWAIQRDRDGEFAVHPATGAGLGAEWVALRGRLRDGLAVLPTDVLTQRLTHPRRGPITGQEVLIVVARHAAEHLGQAELTRDLWRAAGPIGPEPRPDP